MSLASAVAIVLQVVAAVAGHPAQALPRTAGEIEALAAADALPPLNAASEAEVAIACDLRRRQRDDHARKLPALTRDEWAAVGRELDAMIWKKLPSQARCGPGEAVNFRMGELKTFVTEIKVSKDGQFVGLSGGWHIGPLNGGGENCFYRRRGAEYVLIGCESTWVS